MLKKKRLEIHYCTGCKWLLRAGWMAQEILSTFENDLEEVAIVPADGGRFQIILENTVIWDRKREGGFPQPAELKARVRDAIDPDRAIPHIDQAASRQGSR